jgi:hypothetical protein
MSRHVKENILPDTIRDDTTSLWFPFAIKQFDKAFFGPSTSLRLASVRENNDAAIDVQNHLFQIWPKRNSGGSSRPRTMMIIVTFSFSVYRVLLINHIPRRRGNSNWTEIHLLILHRAVRMPKSSLLSSKHSIEQDTLITMLTYTWRN